MDNVEIRQLVNMSPLLKARFLGCCSADQIQYMAIGTFQIVNTAQYGDFGIHWLLLARTSSKMVIFYDSFGRKLNTAFKNIRKHLKMNYYTSAIHQFFPSKSLLQSDKTTLCGLYCIYVAHYVFAGKLSFPTYATEEDVLRFASDNFGVNLPRTSTTIS